MKKLTILLAICITILLLSSVSAFDWDNTKDYDPTTKTVTITNALGLGGEIAKMQLISPQINYVFHGTDRKVAEIKFINVDTSYSETAFRSFEFINLRRKAEAVNREITFKYLTEETVKVPVYSEVCVDSGKTYLNGSKQYDCTWKETGTKDEIKETWTLFSDVTELPKGENITIGLFADVLPSDNVEWIPTFFGVKIEEWAVWQDSMNIGLEHYYTLNGTTGIDSLGRFNMTTLEAGVSNSVTGRIGTAFRFDGNNGALLNAGENSSSIVTGNNLTISMWVNYTAQENAWLYGMMGVEGTNNVMLSRKNSDGRFVMSADPTPHTAEGVTGAFTPDGLWHHWVWMLRTNATSGYWLSFYADGVESLGNYNVIDADDVWYFNAIGKGYQGDGYDFIGSIDEIGIWNRSLTGAEITALYNGGAGLPYVPTAPTDANPTIVLNAPPNNMYNNSQTIIFNWTATDESNVTNTTLYIDGILNDTYPHGLSNYSNIQKTVLIGEGVHNWTVNVSDSGGHIIMATGRNFTVDTHAPNLSIKYPHNATILVTSLSAMNISVNWSVADNIGLASCYFYNGTGKNNLTCGDNNTNAFLSGTHNIMFFANDTTGNFNTTNSTFTVFQYTATHNAEKSTAVDGNTILFNFSLAGTNINTLFPNSSANFTYAGTVYSPDNTSRTASGYTYFEKSLFIPIGSGNATGKTNFYYWNFTIANSTSSVVSDGTSVKNITVYNITLTDCNSTYGRVILNMSMKDEELNTWVATAPANVTNIEVDMIVSDWDNSSLNWTYYHKWEGERSASVCVPHGVLNDSSYKIDFTIGFDNTNHVREFYYLDNGTLNFSSKFNSYTNNLVYLMDLLTADSTTFLFTYTDENDLEVDDIIVHTYRKYIGEGIYREVERSRQDTNGETHVHLVEEDVIYYFMISQYGNILYTSGTYNAKCLSTPCTISLSASPSDINWSLIDNEGGQYSVSTDQETRIVTLTYDIGTASLVNMTLYKLLGSNATVLNATSETGASGTMDLYVPLAYGNATFFVAIYKNNAFVKSVWVEIRDKASDYFGTAGAIYGGIIVLALILMAVSEGVGLIIFTGLGLVVIMVLKLVDMGWVALVSLLVAGGIIIFKLTNRRTKTG